MSFMLLINNNDVKGLLHGTLTGMIKIFTHSCILLSCRDLQFMCYIRVQYTYNSSIFQEELYNFLSNG